MNDDTNHIPVLLKEVLAILHIKNQGLYIDATLGAGGHSSAIIKLGGRVLGLDTDPSMLKLAEEKLLKSCPTPDISRTHFKLLNANFSKMKDIAQKENFAPVDGVLMDLGVSSVHFDDMNRGFSFKNPDASLDMRLDSDTQGVQAADLVNGLDIHQLTVLFELGMNTFEARRLAKKIVNYRKMTKIETVADFLLAGQFHRAKNQKTNPATSAFMALRIAVNTELENLETGLTQAFDILKETGRLVVISFHSGEDRIVKNYFKTLQGEERAKILTKDAIKPSEEELSTNPKARSAILRAIEKN